MNLFERVVELRVGDTDITGLDIAFEIEKDESPEPNPCHVEIYNLGPENRAVLSKYQNVPILLKAGFKEHVGVVFQGDMLKCHHVHEQASWKTVLASGEGILAIQTKRLNKNYAKGTSIKVVIEDLARQMGLPLMGELNNFEELSETLSKGFTTSGNPMKDVCRMLMGKPFNVSVQNQSLQLRRNNEPLQREAISLSANTGLIVSPEVGSKGEIIVRSLLMPDFCPGRQVYISSAGFDTFATIEAVRFAGSTFSEDWEAELRCKML